MKVENNTLKYSSRPVIEYKNNQNQVNSKAHNQSFGAAGGVGNSVVCVMDAVERGGLVASFLIQDFLGMNIPRTLTGLNRNKDITGEWNYMEAAEVGIREFLSGPVMFAVPMIMLWGVKRLFGKANDVQVNVLRAMGDKFAQSTAGKTSADFTNLKAIKQGFYTDLFSDILRNTYNSNADEATILRQAREFASDVLKYEELVDAKKTTKLIDRIRGKQVSGTADEQLAKIVTRFSEIAKENAQNPSQNFLAARLSTDGNPVSKPLSKLITDMRNFTEDAFESVVKKAQSGTLQGKELKAFLKKFTDLRTGSRVLTNISMIAGIIGFCSYIPKLYQLSDTNPGLKGLEGDSTPKKNQALKSKSDNENKLNDTPQETTKPIAFGGAIDSIGRAASKKGGKLSKIFGEFEFDSYNCSFLGLLTACGLGVLVPRLYHAREENEYKEILFRDSVTIGTIACGAKIMQQIVARLCTNTTGFALAIKPKFKEGTSKLTKTLSYLRPVKGHQVLTSDQLQSKYTNIDKYKNGIAGFAQFIDEQGGNIKKMFSIDEKATGLLKSIYESSAKASSVNFESASNKDLIEGLMDVVTNNKASDKLSNLYDIFKDNGNSFLKKAKFMNSSFNFGIIFAISPIILGWLIPRLNESLTKKRQLEKNEQAKAQITETPAQEPINLNNKIEIGNNQQIKIAQTKAAITFKEFIKP